LAYYNPFFAIKIYSILNYNENKVKAKVGTKRTKMGQTKRGQLTGSRRFIDQIEQKLNLRIEFRGQGRPRKKI